MANLNINHDLYARGIRKIKITPIFMAWKPQCVNLKRSI
ncbi:hypothetical protein EVA_04592 [gut metagenome]|uniref:Uncharacterized protein n=1 Tax=gut metagenome TaxID=749906 RepID=J9GIA4_9ZZZZ